MKHQKITKKGDMPKLIESLIDERELNQRLEMESKTGSLSGTEQSFRNATPWYHLNMGYTNPYNVGKVHAELLLIEKHMGDTLRNNSNPIFESIENRELVFYGVGVGDTEIAFVDWILKSGKKEVSVTGIDVNSEFLRNFSFALRNRLIEESKDTEIYFRSYNALFDQITKENINSNSKKAHICLGGTIGNFSNQDEMVKMFYDNMDFKDTLVLGFQLNTNFEVLCEKYENNPLFSDFVRSYIKKENRKDLSWVFDKKSGVISAEHEGIENFRSKKYDLNDLEEVFRKKDLKLIYQTTDKERNIGFQVYEK